MIYIPPKYFCVQEFVPRREFADRGEKAWELLDSRMLITAYNLRLRYGPITFNDWHRGGRFQYSGFRPDDCPEGAELSQHKHGRAGDGKFKDVTAEEVRQDILSKKNLLAFKYITSIELTTSWLHFDVRNCNRIKTYKPW